MKKTKVKHHVRRTKKKVVPVRRHTRKSRAAFTPAREDPDIVAYKKFGKENIKRLPKIGEGRDREVFALGPDKVLKIAKNKVGLAQNSAERALSDYTLPDDKRLDVFETGKDYVVTERADTSKEARQKIRDYLKPLKKFDQDDFNKKKEPLQKAMNKLDLGDYMNYGLAFEDFKQARNWGLVKGNPSLIDGGSMDIESIKGFEKYPETKSFFDKEWEEVKVRKRYSL